MAVKSTDATEKYLRLTWRRTCFIVLLIVLLLILIPLSASLGTASIGVNDVLHALLSRLIPSFSCPSLVQLIVWELRLPRIFMAVVAGAAFAVAGVVMQSVLRNPLASPYTLGVASGAGFGAALAIILGAGIITYRGVTYTNEWLVAVNAFIFALIPSLVVMGLAKFRGARPETMILSGIAMMYLFSAGTALLQYFATPEAVTAVVFWLFGSLSKATWWRLSVVSVTAVSITAVLILKFSWDLNALLISDEGARSLGVDVELVRLAGIVLSSLLTAIPVCFLGTIGFIGLVAPHMTRMVIGGDHRFLIPASCLMGAVLLLAADTVARTIISPMVLPVGIVTSFMGTPLFFYLLIRRKKDFW